MVSRGLGFVYRWVCRAARYRGQGGSCETAARPRPSVADLWFRQSRPNGLVSRKRVFAMKGLNYLLAKAKSHDGRPGFVHLLDPDGSAIDSTRDTYDQAFAPPALATVYQLTKDARVYDAIERLFAFLETGLRSPHGGFIEGIPATLSRRQNPQMLLFEAMIATLNATGDPVYQTRAGDLFSLFITNLYDQQRQILGEYFEED
jgi:mannose/cellobiose epimerase-like protein (N-acyl-D-glucosamine 2-epimerase family)